MLCRAFEPRPGAVATMRQAGPTSPLAATAQRNILGPQ
jgi:hypothetical protein